MKSIDFLVRDDRERTIVVAPNIKTGLVNVVLDESTADVVKTRYDLFFAPGNSFGHMTGGFDAGLIKVFGKDLQQKVLEMIDQKFGGMMPVGQSEVVMWGGAFGIIYTPTMMVPTRFTGVLDPYMFMHSALHAVKRYEDATGHRFLSGMCPLYCTGTGSADPDVAFHQQNTALLEHYQWRSGKYNGCKELFGDGTERFQALFTPNRN